MTTPDAAVPTLLGEDVYAWRAGGMHRARVISTERDDFLSVRFYADGVAVVRHINEVKHPALVRVDSTRAAGAER